MKCKDCPYHDSDCHDLLVYGACPNIDYGDNDIAKEVEEQNLSYTIWKLKGNKD